MKTIALTLAALMAASPAAAANLVKTCTMDEVDRTGGHQSPATLEIYDDGAMGYAVEGITFEDCEDVVSTGGTIMACKAGSFRWDSDASLSLVLLIDFTAGTVTKVEASMISAPDRTSRASHIVHVTPFENLDCPDD